MDLAGMTVLLSMRVTHADGYVEPRDSISHDWVKLLDGAGARIVLLPNGLADPVAAVRDAQPALVILSGGEDINVEPARDSTEIAVLDHCLETPTPVLGVCRGMQLINIRFGGADEPVEGHVAAPHTLRASAPFDALYGAGTETNSFHNRAIHSARLGTGLHAWAEDADGWVEAFCHETAPLIGVMWHPERGGAPAADMRMIETLVREGAFWR